MKNEIGVKFSKIGDLTTYCVDARELHHILQIKDRFSSWFKRKSDQYGFLKNVDYSVNNTYSNIGRPRIDYNICLDMAKLLSLIERNEIGNNLRRFLIEYEKNSHTYIKDNPIVTIIDADKINLTAPYTKNNKWSFFA